MQYLHPQSTRQLPLICEAPTFSLMLGGAASPPPRARHSTLPNSHNSPVSEQFGKQVLCLTPFVSPIPSGKQEMLNTWMVHRKMKEWLIKIKYSTQNPLVFSLFFICCFPCILSSFIQWMASKCQALLWQWVSIRMWTRQIHTWPAFHWGKTENDQAQKPVTGVDRWWLDGQKCYNEIK